VNTSIVQAQTTALQPADEDLQDAFAAFLRLDVAAGDASPDTLRSYRSAVHQYVAWCAENGMSVRLATEDDVRAYRRSLVDQGYTPGSVAQRLAVVRRFYAAAVWRGIRADNPAEGVKAPRERRRPEERINYLTEGDLAILFHRLREDTSLAGLRDRALVALLAIHGLRSVEAHRLNVGDLTTQGDAPALDVHGKGSDRVVYLRDDTAKALNEYLQARQAAGEALDGSSPMFVSHANRTRGHRLARRSIREIVDGHLEACGLKDRGDRSVSTHTLRHTAATLALAKGADVTQVQAMLGHADPRTTMVYAHVVDRVQNNPAALIPVRIA